MENTTYLYDEYGSARHAGMPCDKDSDTYPLFVASTFSMQFSIIISTCDDEAKIGRCLDLIANLDWDNSGYEVIVVDNGSQDRTVTIAREKKARVYVRPGQTIPALCNCGADMAQGEILVFIDVDSMIDKNWLLVASEYIQHNNIECFGSLTIVPEGATCVQKPWFMVRGHKGQIHNMELLKSMTIFVRRVDFENDHGFDESMGTDKHYNQFPQLRTAGHIDSVTEIVANQYGEAALFEQFFKKEYRNLTNNHDNFRRGGSLWNVSPFIAPTLVSGLQMLLTITLMAAAVLTHQNSPSMASIILLMVWQTRF